VVKKGDKMKSSSRSRQLSQFEVKLNDKADTPKKVKNERNKNV